MDNFTEADQIVNEYARLYAEKNSKIALMEIASEFFEPNDDILSGVSYLASSNYNSDEDSSRLLLDTTALQVTRDYITNVLGLSFFQSNRWFRLENTEIEPASENQKILNKRADKVALRIKQSNYYQQIPHHESDIVGYGHGLFFINGDRKKFAKCLSYRPKNVVFKADIYGEVYKVMWEQQYDLKSLYQEFPSMKQYKLKEGGLDQQKPMDTYRVVLSFQHLEEYEHLSELDRIKKVDGYKYVIKHILKDGEKFEGLEGKNFVLDPDNSYFKSKPLFPARDVVRDLYGRGIFRDLIPKARICNSLAFGELEIVRQQYDPALVMDADTFQVTGQNKLSAGMRFVRKPKNFGLEKDRERLVEVLSVTGDLAAVDAIHRRHQEEMIGFLPTASNIYKTARQSIEEIYQRMEQEERKLAPLRANYAKEAVNEHIRRFYELCERAGDFDNLRFDEELEKKTKADSPELIVDGFLLQKHREGELRRIQQALQSTASLAPVAPQSVQSYIDGDRIIKGMWDNLEVFKYLKADQMVKAEREQTANLADRQQRREDQKVEGITAKATADIFKNMLGG